MSKTKAANDTSTLINSSSNNKIRGDERRRKEEIAGFPLSFSWQQKLLQM